MKLTMFWLNNSSWGLKKESIFEMLLLPHRRIPKMQYNITTSLIVSLSENGFGLDELIYRMEELANKKAFPRLLKTIVLLVDENLRLKVMLKQPLPEKCGCTCEHPDLILDVGMSRKIRTCFVKRE